MTRGGDREAWIVRWQPRPRARIRLFCFPYAGGGTLAYRPWAQDLPSEVEVSCVALPGRERRLKEEPYTRITPLLEALMSAMAHGFDRPFAFFGHSMGALLAYEMAHQLRRRGYQGPEHLFVSARRPPHLPRMKQSYYDLPDDEFREQLRRMNGTPDEVLDNEELMNLMMPLVRADFELNESHPPTEHPHLDCPISAFGGLGDRLVERDELAAWGELTSQSFQLRMFAGDHFYLYKDSKDLVIDAVARSL